MAAAKAVGAGKSGLVSGLAAAMVAAANVVAAKVAAARLRQKWRQLQSGGKGGKGRKVVVAGGRLLEGGSSGGECIGGVYNF